MVILKIAAPSIRSTNDDLIARVQRKTLENSFLSQLSTKTFTFLPHSPGNLQQLFTLEE